MGQRSAPYAIRLSRAGMLVGIWVGVGIVSAAQIYLWTHWRGEPASLSFLLTRQIRNALPWVPLTVGIFALARRLPVRAVGRLRWLALHAVTGVATVVALNVVQTGLHWLIEGPIRAYAGWGDAVVGETLRWGPFAFLVYGVLVGIASLRARPSPAGSAIRHDASAADAPQIAVRVGNTVRLVPPADIDWIEGAGDYARLHVNGGSYLSGERLGALADRLAAAGFARIHRSTIVNLARVRGYVSASHGDFVVELVDGTRLRASRRHRAALDCIRRSAAAHS